jgi:tetratricopeptide (TPR) repeat protein
MNDYAYALAEDGRELEKALRLVRRAIAIKSNVGAYHDTHGWVLYKLGRYDEALRELRLAVQTAPDTPDLRYHLAAVYAKLGRKDDALVELEKALALKPGHEPSLQLRKELLGEKGGQIVVLLSQPPKGWVSTRCATEFVGGVGGATAARQARPRLPVQVDAHLRGSERLQPLRQQPRNRARQHIA